MPKKSNKLGFVNCPHCNQKSSVNVREKNLLQGAGKVINIYGVMGANIPLMLAGLGVALAGTAVGSALGRDKVKCHNCN